MLYNLYRDSLRTQLESSRIGCHIAGKCVNHIAYADDMVLLAPSTKALQTLIDVCFKIPGENNILYNETKTQCMAFWPQSYTQCVLPSVALGTASLKFVVEAVYLGHHISSNLKDDYDVYKKVKNLNTNRNVLIRKIASCYEKVKCELFRTHGSAQYSSSLWCSYNLAMHRKLKISHNDILRRLLGVPRYTSARTLLVNKHQDNVNVLIWKQCYNLKLRTEGCHNRVIRSIFDSCSFKASKLFDK